MYLSRYPLEKRRCSPNYTVDYDILILAYQTGSWLSDVFYASIKHQEETSTLFYQIKVENIFIMQHWRVFDVEIFPPILKSAQISVFK